MFALANIAAAATMFQSTAIAQTQAPVALDVPAKSVPVPSTVSPEMQKIVGLPQPSLEADPSAYMHRRDSTVPG